MKKTAMVLLILVVIGGAAFAQHPGGWGLGVVGQYGFNWDGFDGQGGAALSLKMPILPIYFGINVELKDHYFGIGVTADNYLIDKMVVSDINLGWYLGLGCYGLIGIHDDYFALCFGARLPIGVYFMPFKFFEIFFDVAPSLGLDFGVGNDAPPNKFPAGRFTMDFGLRFWF
jgi:hypothetical protein